MTAEQAYCHKLMLEVGLTDSFDRELDELLEKENPLSDLVLALSACGGDRNEQLHILNEFIRLFPREQIDSDAVFSLVADDLWARYANGSLNLKQLLELLHRIADNSGWYLREPWETASHMLIYYDDVIIGWLSEDRFLEVLKTLMVEKKARLPF